MKLRWDNQHVRWGVTSFLVIAASMLFYYGVFHMKTLITGIQTFLGILTPIVYGVVIAFLLTPVLNFLEKKIIYPLLARKEVSVGKKGRKAIRWACVILCMFLFLALIYALIMMILPELIRSIMGLIYSFPAYVKVIQKWLQSFIEKWNLNSDALDTLNQSITTAQDYLTTNILPQMQEMLKNISAGVFELINFLKNFLIGAIVSLYLMADTVAGLRAVNAMLFRHRLDVIVVIRIFKASLQRVMVNVRHGLLCLDALDAHRLELQVRHRAGGILRQRLVNADGDFRTGNQFTAEQVRGQDFLGQIHRHEERTPFIIRKSSCTMPKRAETAE